MQHDRQITITVGRSRKETRWQAQTMALSQFYQRLATPARGTETLAEYLALPKGEQAERKDVGGYVAGTLSGPRRKAGAVTARELVTLDLDRIPAGGTEEVLRRVEGLGCGYCVTSTRKHRPDAPRLRVLLPLDRPVTADEYEPVARRLGAILGLELCDPSTFEAARLMYWPSCAADGAYLYYVGDKPFASAEGLLATYPDWRDAAAWPVPPGGAAPARLAARQGDPLEKPGVVGAFCRVYDVPAAMEAFLPGVYAPTGMPGRYTYTGGSTTGGAVLYDGGKFLYSHHATDPCSGRLVNAFDLVRLHRFGARDDEALPETPVSRLPSYEAMKALAAGDGAVKAQLLRQRQAELEGAFAPVAEEEETGWAGALDCHPKTGLPLATIDNIWIILEHDPRLRGRFALNEFAGRGEVLGALPWDARTARRAWTDSDNAGLYWYLEKGYQITGNGKIDAALSLHSRKHSFNEVRDYLEGLRWDGVPRLDTLFVDYLGAENTPYTRAVARRSFAAAVARAMTPGVKFDYMTILSGPQGIGKSTLLDKMSRGWFNDSIRTFEGKEASELLQGVWLVEVSELDAFRRTDVARIKQFLSLRADRFRAAYARHVQELPRRCVFFGTTNTGDYLRDRTGNRRFWPVDVGVRPHEKTVWRDLPGQVDQIWAEAVVRWRLGEPLFLSGALEQAAQGQQEAHREHNAREGLIADFLSKPVPRDWNTWPLERRRVFWGGNVQGELELVPRERVCALEVWCELLDGRKQDLRYADTAEINGIIEQIPGWVRKNTALKFGYCGAQRGFVRSPPEG